MIISLINLKGGVGKTTAAIALATAAARDGHQVTVYDADQQSSASLWALNAAEADDALPFEVVSANIATIRSLGKEFAGAANKWAFIDCPPNGRVVDEAMRVSDLVIIPTTTGPADMAKAFETAETLSENDIYYAILLNRVVSRTLTLKQSLSEMDERDASYFEARIPQREILKNFFGNSFGDELYGYEKVYEEVKECLANGH